MLSEATLAETFSGHYLAKKKQICQRRSAGFRHCPGTFTRLRNGMGKGSTKNLFETKQMNGYVVEQDFRWTFFG